jgi:hypothetical protein
MLQLQVADVSQPQHLYQLWIWPVCTYFSGEGLGLKGESQSEGGTGEEVERSHNQDNV